MSRLSRSLGRSGRAMGLVLCVSCISGVASGSPDIPGDFERERALEPSSFTYASFSRAWGVLERAMEVHGGKTIHEAYTDLAMSLTGSGTRTSSQTFIGERAEYRVRGAAAFSSLYDAVAFIEEIAVGGQVFRGHTLISRDQLLRVPTGNQVPDDDAELEAERRAVELLLPYHWLERAAAARDSLRWMGEHELQGAEVVAVSFGDEQGGATLLMDAETGVLRRVEILTTHMVQGDASAWIEFDEYEEFAGHLLPTVRRERSVEGLFIREAEISFENIRADTVLPSNIFNLPIEYRFANPRWIVTERVLTDAEPVAPWRTIAPGLHAVDLVDRANSQVIVVEQADHCVVFNSPLRDELAREVLRSVEANLDGKPVRYVVCATYHPRFAGGLRTYVQSGARIVTTPANAGYFLQVLGSPSRLSDDMPDLEVDSEMLLLVEDRLTLGEGDGRLEVFDLGERSRLTRSYLVGWHPESSTVLTSDLFAVLTEGSARGASPRTQGLYEWLVEAGLQVRRLVPSSPINGHKRETTMEDLAESINAALGGPPVIGPPVPGR